MLDLRRRPVLLFAVVILLVLAGCGEDQNQEELRSETLAQLEEVKAQHQQVLSRYNSLNQKTQSAKEKGVRIKNTTTKLNEAKHHIRTAEEKRELAKEKINESEYQAAQDLLRSAGSHLDTANNSISKAKDALERSYKAALRSSKADLQNAYQEYQIAVEYVTAASKAGAETAKLGEQIKANRERIKKAQQAIKERNPRKANRLSQKVRASSKEIQDRSMYVARRSIAQTKITKVKGKIRTQTGQKWLDKAIQSAEKGHFEKVEKQLRLTQYAEQIAIYSRYSRQVTAKEGVNLQDLNQSLEEHNAAISREKVLEKRLDSIRNSVRESRDCLQELNKAENITRTVRDEQAVLLSANFSRINSRIEEAKSKLSSGKYKQACKSAKSAQKIARNELQDLRQRKSKQWFVLDLGKITGGSDPVRIRPPSTRHVNIEKMNISYSPPSDIETKKLNISDDEVSIDIAESTKKKGGSVIFESSAQQIGECGATCRTAKASLVNTGDITAHNVVVSVKIYVDKSGGKEVWSDTIEAGNLKPNERVTMTREIEVGVGGFALKRHGAKIVIKITSAEKDRTLPPKHWAV